MKIFCVPPLRRYVFALALSTLLTFAAAQSSISSTLTLAATTTATTATTTTTTRMIATVASSRATSTQTASPTPTLPLITAFNIQDWLFKTTIGIAVLIGGGIIVGGLIIASIIVVIIQKKKSARIAAQKLGKDGKISDVEGAAQGMSLFLQKKVRLKILVFSDSLTTNR